VITYRLFCLKDGQILSTALFEADDDIAAVLSYITGLDHKPVSYTAADIKKARALPRRGPGDMAAMHTSLAAKKVVP